jgi:hypothetical protein
MPAAFICKPGFGRLQPVQDMIRRPFKPGPDMPSQLLGNTRHLGGMGFDLMPDADGGNLLASVGAGGAVLGLLAAFLIMGRGDAREFGKYPQAYCTTAGGQVVTNPEGRRFCAIWIDRPSQSGG